MSGSTDFRSILLVLLIPVVLLLLYSADLVPGRYLITYGADNFEPWMDEGKSPSFSPDCLQSYYPRRVFAREALMEGRLPLWDPTSFCGQPFLANFQSGVFYPVNLLLLPFTAAQSLGLYVWIHLLLAGIGMYLFLHSIGVSRSVSVIGGLLFAVNGALAARTGQATMLATPAWIPMILYLAGRSLERGGIVLLALCWACAILSGFPPILAWSFLFVTAWTFWRWLPLRKARGWKPLFRTAAGLLLGFCLAGVQLVPTIEFIAQSDRVRFPFETLLSSAWHPAVLIRFLLPGYFGSPLAGTDWFHLLSRGNGHYFQSFISTSGYLGIGTFLFAIGGTFLWRQERSVRFFLVAALIGFVVLLGSPILHIVSALPGLGGSRVDRVVFIPVIALIALAAICIDRTAGEGASLRRWLPGTAALFAIVMALAWLFRSGIALALAGPPVMPYLDTSSISSGVLVGFLFLAASVALAVFLARSGKGGWAFLPLALLILVADPGLLSRRLHITIGEEDLPVETDGIRFLAERSSEGRIVRYDKNVIPPNLPGIFGLRDVAGYNALTIRRYRRYFMAMALPSVKERRINPLKAVASVHSPLLARLSARWIVGGADTEPPDLPLVYDGEMRVFENEQAYPRAYLTYRLVTVPGPRPAFELLSHPRTPPLTSCVEHKEIVLAPDEGGMDTVGDWFAAHGEVESSFGRAESLDDRVKIVVDEPERIAIDCVSRGGRILVLADTWYPGWVGEVDGVPAEIHQVNRAFRGIVVPGGIHRVEFRYEPASLRAGLLLSVVSLLAVGMMTVLPFVRTRKRKVAGA